MSVGNIISLIFLLLAIYFLIKVFTIKKSINNRNKNKEQNINNKEMAKKKKKTKAEQEILDQVAQDLINSLDKKEIDNKFKTATVIDEITGHKRVEQPIILCSDETFENHTLNLCNGLSLGFPTKALPYLIKSLTELYNKNGLDYFNGDQKALDAHTLSIYDNNKLEVIDLNVLTPDPVNSRSGSCPAGAITENDSIGEALGKVYMNNMDVLKNMTTSELLDLKGDMEKMRDIIEEAEEKRDMLGATSQQDHKKEVEKKIMENIKELESKLVGKKEDKSEDITFEKIKDIYLKYGDKAAKEELMRVPAEKRDEILAKMLDIVKKQ